MILTVAEQLEQEAFDNNVFVDYMDFISIPLKGLYIDGSIAIKKGMSFTETADILAEELGHHYTTVGNILNQNNVSARKQEQSARLWAYNRRLGLSGIIKAYERGCKNTFEIASYLKITEEFLTDALERYRNKYGVYIEFEEFIIFFEPHLTVMKKVFTFNDGE